MTATKQMTEELWQVWQGIAPDAIEGMLQETGGDEDGDWLAETLLDCAESYLTGASLTEWRHLSSTQRHMLALETVTS